MVVGFGVFNVVINFVGKGGGGIVIVGNRWGFDVRIRFLFGFWVIIVLSGFVVEKFDLIMFVFYGLFYEEREVFI